MVRGGVESQHFGDLRFRVREGCLQSPEPSTPDFLPSAALCSASPQHEFPEFPTSFHGTVCFPRLCLRIRTLLPTAITTPKSFSIIIISIIIILIFI